MANVKERRKFPRINSIKYAELMLSLKEINVKIKGHENIPVYDISYKGIALGKIPENFNKDEFIFIDLNIADFSPIKVNSKFIWQNDKLIGFEFIDYDSETFNILDKFFKDKLSGKFTKLINKKYLNEEDNLTYWFHGPNDTNIYLWEERSDKIFFSKVIVEIWDRVLTIDKEQNITLGLRSLNDKDVVESLNSIDKKFIDRIIDFLTQIEDGEDILKPLIDILKSFQNKNK